jgi:hypothetical protein
MVVKFGVVISKLLLVFSSSFFFRMYVNFIVDKITAGSYYNRQQYLFPEF